MADETAYFPASASLLDHCRMLGIENDPKNFATSVPEGIWATQHGPLMDEKECDGGVPIYRVDHKMNSTGMIFTPQDVNTEALAAWAVQASSTKSNASPGMPPQTSPACQSASLLEFCAALGERHDPNQFGTSVPGGCWGQSASPARATHRRMGSNSSLGEKGGGVPIRRVDHKMNTDGVIFTPSQNIGFMVGSLGSESEASSYMGSPSLSLFENRTANPASAATVVAAAVSHMQQQPPPPLKVSEEEPINVAYQDLSPQSTYADDDLPFDDGMQLPPPEAKRDDGSKTSSEHSSKTSSAHSSPASSCILDGSESRGEKVLARPRWLKDHDCDACGKCQRKFGLFLRKHHCRACGNIFCGSCSSSQITMPHLGYHNPVRVCDGCCVSGGPNKEKT